MPLPRHLIALGLTVAGGCSAGRIVPPAAAPLPAAVAAAPAGDSARHGYTAADVRFMQQMILHHAQAVRMSALVPARTGSDAIRTLSGRIDASQQSEIGAMRHWLEERHEPAPWPAMARAVHDSIAGTMHAMPDMHDMPADGGDMSAMRMPGMLTAAEMQALAGAHGTAFDRRFLEGMIRHHEGALAMVAALLATPGAAQEPQLFGFASDVDSGQRAEIRRMQAILAALPDSVRSP